MNRYDVAIIGAGMAGAGLAAALSGEARVLLLEAEDRPGYHSTGRSAAFWSESYGGPLVQPLTSASYEALQPYLHPRGCIHLADAAGEGALADLAAEFDKTRVALEPMVRTELEARIPGLKAGWRFGLSEPSCMDIDVAALHAGCPRAAKGDLVTNARITGAERADGRWRIATSAGEFEADILVNAAGAWADAVALLAGERPLGIKPYRRTIAQLRIDPPAPADLPLIIDALGRFYLKPEAGGRLWLSPHDETPCAPCDAAPEELDVAVAIDRLEQVVDWRILAVEHKWAGLRSFAPDRLPVYGFSASGRGFFWCAGQGGFGIQTAPAASALAAALLLGRPAGAVDPAPYAATRFDPV
ncbi:NAD(P)/FAD-dependent oxidoreductase [Allosphingosinicella sp.]|uniref:NAD(P)/FAD-dependent oxidoreductase n=1 Tax=Allosphingosinicella sp. TaxID=2823234 RepID=UPI003783933E